MQNFAKFRDSLLVDLNCLNPFITSDMSLADIRCTMQASSSFKKFVDEVSPEADSKCLDLFLESNTICRDFSLSPRTNQQQQVIYEVTNLFYDLLYRADDVPVPDRKSVV